MRASPASYSLPDPAGAGTAAGAGARADAADVDATLPVPTISSPPPTLAAADPPTAAAAAGADEQPIEPLSATATVADALERFSDAAPRDVKKVRKKKKALLALAEVLADLRDRVSIEGIEKSGSTFDQEGFKNEASCMFFLPVFNGAPSMNSI